MRICKSCNSFFEDDGTFCSKCGSKTTEYVPIEIAPAMTVDYTPATVIESAPATVITNNPSVPAKIMSYIGLGFGIFGFVLGLIFFICSFASFGEGASALGTVVMVYTVFSMGGSIAGLSLTSKASFYGVYSDACTTGKTLSAVGLAINILTVIISFFGAIA